MNKQIDIQTSLNETPLPQGQLPEEIKGHTPSAKHAKLTRFKMGKRTASRELGIGVQSFGWSSNNGGVASLSINGANGEWYAIEFDFRTLNDIIRVALEHGFAPSFIAAEPELLKACKKAEAFIAALERLELIEPNSNSGLDWDSRFVLRAAIAKAENK